MAAWQRQFAELIEATQSEWHLYSFFAHGWLNDKDPNPEYLGATAWSIGDLSVPIDSEQVWGTEAVSARPTSSPLRARIATASDDFGGLMDCGRLLVAQAMIFAQSCRDHSIPADSLSDRLYWANMFAALATLGSALERLRALVQSLDSTSRRRKPRDETSVDRLLRIVPVGPTETAYRRRCEVCAEDARWIIETRNELIHQVGSPEGRQTHDLANHTDRYIGDTSPHPDLPPKLVRGYQSVVEFGNYVLLYAARRVREDG